MREGGECLAECWFEDVRVREESVLQRVGLWEREESVVESVSERM